MLPEVGLVAWFVLFAAISAIGTALARNYAIRRRLIDEPGERRSHQIATPRGGGIAIVLAMLIALIAMIVRMPIELSLLVGATIGLLLVAVSGWIDDHQHLSPWLRLAAHGLAGLSLATGMVLSGSSIVAAVLVFTLTVVLVNVWNFMDGIDGLAATQAGIAAVALLSCAGSTVLLIHLGLALAAAICGFLPFNLPRARIFLGDVGSGSLGYLLAMMVGLAMDRLPAGAWPLLLLPLSAFVLDAGLTLLTRILRGEQWWAPHVEHAYQRWARRVGSHSSVTLGYAVWTLLACIGVWSLAGMDSKRITMATVIWLGVGGLIWYWLRSRPIPLVADHGGRS